MKTGGAAERGEASTIGIIRSLRYKFRRNAETDRTTPCMNSGECKLVSAQPINSEPVSNASAGAGAEAPPRRKRKEKSVLMPLAWIVKDARIRHAIIEEGVRIPAGFKSAST